MQGRKESQCSNGVITKREECSNGVITKREERQKGAEKRGRVKECRQRKQKEEWMDRQVGCIA
jgi:hypothetical protein